MSAITSDEQARWAAQRARAIRIEPGDQLTVDPTWNRRWPRVDPLGTVCHVTAVDLNAQSQTGVMVTVRGWDGPVTLDAGWFVEVQREGER